MSRAKFYLFDIFLLYCLDLHVFFGIIFKNAQKNIIFWQGEFFMYDYLIVGSGLFGAVFAYEAKNARLYCFIC